MAEKINVLLPSGLYDLLPPDARKESVTVAKMLAAFEAFGYAQVSPPLLEFEASLLSGRGDALSSQVFRMMDPLSQSMMGFRADITLQIARIASTRMMSAPKPLRLCYVGPILLIKPEPLRSQRQLTQAGIELIGSDSKQADAEVMIVAAQTLLLLGITEVSIDINLPGLLRELCPEAQADEALQSKIKDAISHKDVSMIAKLPLANSALLCELVEAAGPADKALKALHVQGISQAEALGEVIARVKHACPEISITLDPIEFRGFDYHQGISFSIFAKGLRHELGRGGRYVVEGENATGFTLYVTHLLRLVDTPEPKKTILVPADISADALTQLHTDGFTTLYTLSGKPTEEAGLLKCMYLWEKGKCKKL